MATRRPFSPQFRWHFPVPALLFAVDLPLEMGRLWARLMISEQGSRSQGLGDIS